MIAVPTEDPENFDEGFLRPEKVDMSNDFLKECGNKNHFFLSPDVEGIIKHELIGSNRQIHCEITRLLQRGRPERGRRFQQRRTLVRVRQRGHGGGTDVGVRQDGRAVLLQAQRDRAPVHQVQA